MRFEPRHTAAAILLAAGALPLQAAQPARPLIPVYTAAEISTRCDAELAAARKMLKAMEARKGAGDVLAELNALSIQTADFANPVYLLQNVAPDKATRDAAQTCLEKLLPFETEVYQSALLYERVRAVKAKDSIDTVYLQDLSEKFEDGGATLPVDKRKRAKEINDELERLGLDFQKNINEDGTTVTITPAEAAGMPESWIAARKRDDQGNLVLGMDYPTYLPFLELATNAEARKRVWMAKNREGGEKNLKILEQALALRYELAQLHGQPDFATYTLKRRMAQTPAAVYDFLGKVKEAADPLQAKEFAELRAEKAKLDGTPSRKRELNRWDVEFLKERVRKARYSVDQEALRAYFPTEPSVQYAMLLASKLYSVDFVARDVPRWHKDVRYYDVYERRPTASAARSSAASIWICSRATASTTTRPLSGCAVCSTLANRTPISVLVANLNREGTQPRRTRDAAARIRSRTAWRAVEDALRRPVRHLGQARLRRGAVADVRGMGATRGAAGAVRDGLPDLPAADEGADRATRGRARFGRGNYFARQGEYGAVRHAAAHRQARRADAAVDRD